MKYPRIRFLNIQPFGSNFIIEDPYGISETILVKPSFLLLLSLMDGTKSDTEIKAEYFRKTGVLLKDEEYREILNFLKERGFLEDENFFEKLKLKRKEMLLKKIKEPFHAGMAYPAEKEKLKELLQKHILNQHKESVLGILVPHMDLRIALPTYGKTYGISSAQPETVVILGVSHYLHETPFSVCPLHYKTPLGIAETDEEIIKEIKNAFDHDVFHDILSYEKEHSIEFQMIFIKYLFPKAKVVPIIISYGDENFLKVVSERLSRVFERRNILLISSVDFSHVGKKFGDRVSYDPSKRDKDYIQLLSNLDSYESFHLLNSDGNRTRIDGQFTNFVFLEILKNLGASKGKEIDYQIYYEKETDSIVTYCGMIFR